MKTQTLQKTIKNENWQYLADFFKNGRVVCDKNDKNAGEIFKALFPEKEIIPVNCLKLIEEGGSLHCSTMQIVY